MARGDSLALDTKRVLTVGICWTVEEAACLRVIHSIRGLGNRKDGAERAGGVEGHWEALVGCA
jgi:hypothetical protein